MAEKGKPAAEEARPVIIRRKKVIAGGHHGGAWKVAYADFVTALMAFFLVMWLVASVNDQQKSAIFEYFKNPSMERGLSSVSAQGQSGPGGASTSPIELRGGLTASAPAPIAGSGAGMPEVEKNAEVSDKAKLETLRDELRDAIEKSTTLEEYKDQLLLDITPEGLRIQIVDAFVHSPAPHPCRRASNRCDNGHPLFLLLHSSTTAHSSSSRRPSIIVAPSFSLSSIVVPSCPSRPSSSSSPPVLSSLAPGIFRSPRVMSCRVVADADVRSP